MRLSMIFHWVLQCWLCCCCARVLPHGQRFFEVVWVSWLFAWETRRRTVVSPTSGEAANQIVHDTQR